MMRLNDTTAGTTVLARESKGFAEIYRLTKSTVSGELSRLLLK
jgi:hypothetical protein